MSPRSKREYVESIFLRYRKSRKKQKSTILNEFCAVCGYNRKYAIRRLNRFKRFRRAKAGKRGARPRYKREVILPVLKEIWIAANFPCSKLLKFAIPLWLPFCKGHIAGEIKQLLLDISPATIDRILKPIKSRYKKRGRSTTKPGTLLRKQIPIKVNQWDEKRPGFLEADTIAHCGGSLMGEFIYTVDFVDIATEWTEQRAVWGKGEAGVLEQIADVEKSLPFPLLGFDCDNGGEFLNYHLMRHFLDRESPIQFTRSRSYHKEDNAHIEQKNWTHVRQWLGYERFDNPELVKLLNELYTTEWNSYHNFFMPSVKLVEKERIGSKTIKRHDRPKTPCQRILESPDIPEETKDALRAKFKTLNPFILRKQMNKKFRKIFSRL